MCIQEFLPFICSLIPDAVDLADVVLNKLLYSLIERLCADAKVSWFVNPNDTERETALLPALCLRFYAHLCSVVPFSNYVHTSFVN